MNKAQLIDAIATKTGLSKADAKKSLDAVLETVQETLQEESLKKEGKRISLVGFGSFSVSQRNARTGRNPQTGAEIQIAAKNVVKFSPGSELNASVNPEAK